MCLVRSRGGRVARLLARMSQRNIYIFDMIDSDRVRFDLRIAISWDYGGWILRSRRTAAIAIRKPDSGTLYVCIFVISYLIVCLKFPASFRGFVFRLFFRYSHTIHTYKPASCLSHPPSNPHNHNTSCRVGRAVWRTIQVIQVNMDRTLRKVFAPTGAVGRRCRSWCRCSYRCRCRWVPYHRPNRLTRVLALVYSSHRWRCRPPRPSTHPA
jgi:hypothetical protein